MMSKLGGNMIGIVTDALEDDYVENLLHATKLLTIVSFHNLQYFRINIWFLQMTKVIQYQSSNIYNTFHYFQNIHFFILIQWNDKFMIKVNIL